MLIFALEKIAVLGLVKTFFGQAKAGFVFKWLTGCGAKCGAVATFIAKISNI